MDALDKLTLALTACLVVVALLFPLTARDRDERRDDGAGDGQDEKKRR